MLTSPLLDLERAAAVALNALADAYRDQSLRGDAAVARDIADLIVRHQIITIAAPRA